MISEKLYIWNELFLAALRISSKSCILHFNTNSLINRKKTAYLSWPFEGTEFTMNIHGKK